MGTLYVVATPIGNLDDLSPRAVRVLSDVSLIAAEDTRHTGRLLTRFGIETPMVSYHAFNERARRDQLLAALDAADVALVSDAGTPGIADPGQALVDTAFAAGHTVSPIPGASSLTSAISVSGLIDGPFVVLGFLPRKGPERARTMGVAATCRLPVVLFEAPARLVATLRDLARTLGNRPAVVARELTKLHEEVRRDSLLNLVDRFERDRVRGEIVIVVGGPPPEELTEAAHDEAIAVVAALLRSGLKPSEAAREAARITGRPRSDLYNLARTLCIDGRTESGGQSG
ncbi:MAG: 16S rRNA (cytidine(1402)-2'-O)-methyltransferase [Thermomicrobiales bacterium]